MLVYKPNIKFNCIFKPDIMDNTINLPKIIEALYAENKQLKILLKDSELEIEKINQTAKDEASRIRNLLTLMLPMLEEDKKIKENQFIQCNLPGYVAPSDVICVQHIDENLEQILDELNETCIRKQDDENLKLQLEANSAKLKTQSVFLQSKLESLQKQKSELEDTISDLLLERKTANEHFSSLNLEPAFMKTFDKYV